MGNSTKKFLATFAFFMSVYAHSMAQTIVGGGIYSNTTWTLANSPYIVVDTVVVFPGITLTIQPGVVVKFENDIQLEIRQSNLIAAGTSTDSIYFTSNSLTPAAKAWSGIYLNGGIGTDTFEFSYCNFTYALIALDGTPPTSNYSIEVKNSTFNDNWVGLASAYCSYALVDSCSFNNNEFFGIGELGNAKINACTFMNNKSGLGQKSMGEHYDVNNCSFIYNQVGIDGLGFANIYDCIFKNNEHGVVFHKNGQLPSTIKNCIVDSNIQAGVTLHHGDSLINCKIRYNYIGIIDSINQNWALDNIIGENTIEYNNIGIKLFKESNQIYCNEICDNIVALYNNISFGGNFNAENNYWCTTDSASIASEIYDGYDNINLGIVNFMPFDTAQCQIETGIPFSSDFSFSLYPNPAEDHLRVIFPAFPSKKKIKIFNLLGELEYYLVTEKQMALIDISSFANSIHIIQINAGDNIFQRRFIKL